MYAVNCFCTSDEKIDMKKFRIEEYSYEFLSVAVFIDVIILF